MKAFVIVFLVILGIILLDVFGIVPNFINKRPYSKQKSCFANMRVLTGAIEEYNLENNASFTLTENSAQILIQQEFLKGIPKCPGRDYAEWRVNSTILHSFYSWRENWGLNLNQFHYWSSSGNASTTVACRIHETFK